MNETSMPLWVLWKKPSVEIPEDNAVLSFLSPIDENELTESNIKNNFIGREVSQSTDIRSKALQLYNQIIAEIGIAPGTRGQTLRQSLLFNNTTSAWWFHPVTSRNTEGDPTFNTILQILTIRKIGTELGVKKIVLCGAPHGVSKILSALFSVSELDPGRTRNKWLLLLRGIASRVKFGIVFFSQYLFLRMNYQVPECRYDMVFSGFWDWSFWWDHREKKLSDRYFMRLPQELRDKQIKNIGYFAWFEPNYEPGKKKRPLSQVLKPLNGRDDVVLLQALLSPSEVITELIDFRPLLIFLKVLRQNSFHNVFRKEKVNWLPIFQDYLYCGFLNKSIPFQSLVMNATEKAIKQYKPRLTLSFLEHFLFSRAHYAGVKQSGISAVCWTIQHASYNHEKTLYFLHPHIEFQGSPDDCKVPRPDQIFVMGKLGFQLFEECGYSIDQIKPTGSTRYDHIHLSISNSGVTNENVNDEISVLLVNTLNDKIEIEMLEAVCLSVISLNNIHIRLRNHPFSKLDKHPRFKRWRNNVEISKFSLEEDLSWSDLIIFTYSSVAGEAFLRGKPVWQWLPPGFNGSALSEVLKVPSFSSISSLRNALIEFIAKPDSYLPTDDQISEVIEQLFYPCDGLAAKRIANLCKDYLKIKQSQSAY